MQFSQEELDLLSEHRPRTATRWIEPRHHVEAFAVIDRGAAPPLGEARMGGPDVLESLRLACRLARSTSIRAGLLGVARAGAAVVVVDEPKLDRGMLRSLFRERLPASGIRARIGSGLDELADLEQAVPTPSLGELRAEVLTACLAPLALEPDASALVLGAGPIGADAVRALRSRGSSVVVWDEDERRAHALAESSGASLHPGPWSEAEVSLVVPCTAEAIVEAEHAEHPRMRAVCGLVPWVLASPEVGQALESKGVRVVPPLLGAAAEIIALLDAGGVRSRAECLALLGSTAEEVLASPEGAGARALSLAVARAQADVAGS